MDTSGTCSISLIDIESGISIESSSTGVTTVAKVGNISHSNILHLSCMPIFFYSSMYMPLQDSHHQTPYPACAVIPEDTIQTPAMLFLRNRLHPAYSSITPYSWRRFTSTPQAMHIPSKSSSCLQDLSFSETSKKSAFSTIFFRFSVAATPALPR